MPKTFVLTLSHPSDATLRTARAKRRDGRWPVWVPKALVRSGKVQRRVQRLKRVRLDQLTSSQAGLRPLDANLALRRPGGSWRGGRTRSHSEHGRETPQRRWYSVSRRGRVGRCQVCKAQANPENKDHLLASLTALAETRAALKRPFCFARPKSSVRPLHETNRFAICSAQTINPFGIYVTAINPIGIYAWRGVEQPGSSSGS
jgi:hypothetical protein